MKKLLLSAMTIIFAVGTYAQRNCGSHLNMGELQRTDTVKHESMRNDIFVKSCRCNFDTIVGRFNYEYKGIEITISCNGKGVVKTLTNEPAYVRKRGGVLFPFVFDIATRYNGMRGRTLIPCEDIPEKFRIDGLSVSISGNVIDCSEFPESSPEIRVGILNNFFELTNIKTIK
jgi:hypothetical protein